MELRVSRQRAPLSKKATTTVAEQQTSIFGSPRYFFPFRFFLWANPKHSAANLFGLSGEPL
jgi:hypothetical protein